MSKDSKYTQRFERAERLKSIKDKHKERTILALRSTTEMVQSIGKMFDEYLGMLLSDLEEEVDILEQEYYDLGEEKEKLKGVRAKFSDIETKLDVMLQRSRDGEITSFEHFDFGLVRQAWDLMLEIEELRNRIDKRYSKKHLHDIEIFKELFERKPQQF